MKSIFTSPNISKILEYLILALIIFLPFHTIISVFFTFKIVVPGINFFKEGLLMLIAGCGAIEYLRRRELPRLTRIDWWIIMYIVVLTVITVVNGFGLRHLAFGGRYDFEFFLAFILIRHVLPLTTLQAEKILTYFLISGGLALTAGICVRFLFGEMILLKFGFSQAVSNWSFNGAPPIYHGVAHASVVRFQGIFDGPNQAAYFLLVYMGAFAHRFFPMKGYDVFAGMVLCILIYLLILTYSRSAYLGLIAAGVIGVISTIDVIIMRKFGHLPRREQWKRGMSYIWKKFRTVILSICVVGGIIVLGFLAANYGKMEALIGRQGSTFGHIERFVIGTLRFADRPWGTGLGTSGPASRSLYDVSEDDMDFVSPSARVQHYLETAASLNEHHEFTSESYYIPESWYIQQLVEGGVIGFVLFFMIVGSIFFSLFRSYPWLCAGFAGVLVMSLVLHTFESMYTSLILFVLIGAFLSPRPKHL